jgi:transketolase
MDDIKQFRQWGSRTPGHPEYGVVPGAEVTTGPLGQGLGNAVGLAIAERWLAATFNRPGHEMVNHHTYVMASDGDMMEGVAAEAASIAGQFRLGRLIVLYDANQITLSASADVTFREDVGARFQAYGWHVEHIDGMDIAAVDGALTKAKAVDDRPSLIVARTHIGYGSPHKHDTFQAHGEPLGVEEVRLTKRALAWPEDKSFYIPDEALAQFRRSVEKGRDLEAQWHRRVDGLRAADPQLADELRQTLAGELPKGWDAALPRFTPADGAMATRDAGQKTIVALAEMIPNLVGGSGDLDPSTRTALKGHGDFESPEFTPPEGAPPTQGMVGGPLGYAGRNIHFGIREHAMAGIATGMALHGGILPYAATFFTFSDYMRPSIRLAALSKAHVIYVWTHDSIGLGEDGPTHQPVEQLASLRAIPDLMLLRPADANETVEAWKIAVAHTEGPVGLVLTRQKLPTLDRSTLAPAAGTAKGAYVLADCAAGPPKLILIATGSEVSIALEAHDQLTREGVASRVVSMPCWDLFQAQPQSYKDMVLPPGVKARVSVEAGSPLGWERYVGLEGAIIGLNRFGASAPGEIVMRELGFTPEHIVKVAKSILAGNRPG